MYNNKNIRTLLVEGFSEQDLREFCFDEKDFQPLYKQLPQEAGKNKIALLILDFAIRNLKVEKLLEWAESRNRTRYEKHSPYLQSLEASDKSTQNFFMSLEGNQLGHGITLGGMYQGKSLKIAAIDWAEYGTIGKVRSGWLYVPQLTTSHSVAFFKLHINDDGTGYIHLVDVASPPHPIWLETEAGYRNEQNFHYDNKQAQAYDVWFFDWRKGNIPQDNKQETKASARKISLLAWNGKYINAKDGGGGKVFANRDKIDESTTFTLIELEDNKIGLRAHNGDYVCAEGGGGREIIASRKQLSHWETFELVKRGDDRVALRVDIGQYVSVEDEGGDVVVAQRNSPHERATFRLINHPKIEKQFP